MISPNEFLQEMSEVKKLRGEELHIKADALLIRLIRSLSPDYEEGLAIYDDLPLEYSY